MTALVDYMDYKPTVYPWIAQNRYGLYIPYLGIEYYPVVNISLADIMIAKATKDRWSCCVIDDDGMANKVRWEVMVR